MSYVTASASFLATRCLKQIALDVRESHTKISNVIKSDFYVDDLIIGAETENKTVELAKEMSLILSKYCFDLRKWTSNSKQVLESLGSEERENIGYYIAKDERHRTLGVF